MKNFSRNLVNVVAALILTTPCLFSNAYASETRSELARLSIEAANKSAVAAMLLDKSKETRYLCATQKYSCLTQSGVESALGLFFAGKDKSYRVSLLNMIRFKLDGGGAELFHSYLYALPAIEIKKLAQSVDPGALAELCKNEVLGSKKMIGQPLSAGPADVCRTEKEIGDELVLLHAGA